MSDNMMVVISQDIDQFPIEINKFLLIILRRHNCIFCFWNIKLEIQICLKRM